MTVGSSGNAEIGPALAITRANARDLARNNPYGKRAVREWGKRVVDYGITPQADTGNVGVNAIIDERWTRWVPWCMSDRRMPFYAAQKMIVRSAFESGECLVRMWDRPLTDGLPVPFQIQLLESDYLDTSKTQTLENGYIIQGVQFDPIGRIVGYWLFGQHPGDVVQTSTRGLTSKLITADRVLHHCELERPGDVRAVTRFAAVMNKLRDIDECADAYIVRAKIEACMAMFVGQPEGPDGATLGPITDSAGRKIEGFAPGMIAYGQAGQKPEFFTPSGSGDFAAHKKSELREVATGLDIPYVVLADDLSDVNYSSYRGGAVAYREAIDEYRWNWFIPQVLDPIWKKFIDTLAMMGVIREPIYGVKWNPPPFELLDRKNEAEADEIELRLGKKSWPQLIGEQGIDPEKQYADVASWKPRLDKAGVTFTPKGVTNAQDQPAAPAV